ncbi:hypothetical protein APY07_07380 [Cutibacterium avidum]|nr:hypothetical protein APY07_07380 [Cutibacterium avidum]
MVGAADAGVVAEAARKAAEARPARVASVVIRYFFMSIPPGTPFFVLQVTPDETVLGRHNV